MHIPHKSLEDGFSLPVLGLGTWTMGGKRTVEAKNDEKDTQALQAAIDLGYTHIDTAEIYAGGHTEELVGQAVKKYDRKKLFLTSKVAGEHARYDDVLESLQMSLKRLQTDYLDLYLVHYPNPDVPIAHTMKALDRLVQEKLVKHIGVSNFSEKRFEEAQFYAENKLVANQLHYNLIYREVERKHLVTYCENNDVLLIAYRPLEKGKLAQTGITLLDHMSKKYKKTPSQIALNWLISQANIVTLVKSEDGKHLKENLSALDWQMSPLDIEKLRNEFPDQQAVSNTRELI